MRTSPDVARPSKQVAIIVSSQYGQSAKIARFIRDRFLVQGHHVSLFNFAADEAPDLTGCDTVIIGGPVYIGKFSKQLTVWTKENVALLNDLTCGFFSVSLNAADKRPQARKADGDLIRLFLNESSLKPMFVACFPGALRYREYGLVKRWILRRISAANGGPTDTSRDHELTDWIQVANFTDAISNGDNASPFGVENRLGAYAQAGTAPLDQLSA